MKGDAQAGDEPQAFLGPVLQMLTSNAMAGTERHVVGLTRELRAIGCDARIVCRPSADIVRGHARREGLPIQSISSAAFDRPGLLHAHDGRAATIAALLSVRRGGSRVRTQHFLLPASAERTGPAGAASLWAHRTLNRRFDGYLAVSQRALTAAVTRGEVGKAAVALIPPGIGLPDSAAVDVARRVRQLSSGPVITSAGRMERERRFDVLLRAIPYVLDRFPNSRFVLCGSGRAEPELRHLARELGIDRALTWTGWLAGIDEVLASSHLYVNTWPHEGFGMATAEAMAWAMPVVVTTSGASAELIDDGRAGVAIEPSEPGELAVAICRILGDHRFAAQIGERAREHAQRYSIRATAAATLDFYRRIRANQLRGGG
jgi:glycosyltransferase involved in cell wall biosynthesis